MTIRERIDSWKKKIDELVRPSRLSEEQKAALRAQFAAVLVANADAIEEWIRLSTPDEIEGLLIEVFKQFLANLKNPPTPTPTV